MTYEEWYQNLEKEFEKDQIRQLEKKERLKKRQEAKRTRDLKKKTKTK